MLFSGKAISFRLEEVSETEGNVTGALKLDFTGPLILQPLQYGLQKMVSLPAAGRFWPPSGFHLEEGV